MRLAMMLVVAVALAIGGCASEPGVLSLEADGTTVDAAVGEEVVVELPSNPSTGYSWQVVDAGPCEEPAAAEYIEDRQDEAVVGASGIERFTFTRTNAQAGTIALEYRRPWEDASTPAEDTWSVRLEAQ